MSKPNLKMTTNTILRTSPRFLDIKKRLQRIILKFIIFELDYNYGRLHKLVGG